MERNEDESPGLLASIAHRLALAVLAGGLPARVMPTSGRGENIAGTANRLDQQPHQPGRHPDPNQPIPGTWRDRSADPGSAPPSSDGEQYWRS
jgi:hypothetical protein